MYNKCLVISRGDGESCNHVQFNGTLLGELVVTGQAIDMLVTKDKYTGIRLHSAIELVHVA